MSAAVLLLLAAPAPFLQDRVIQPGRYVLTWGTPFLLYLGSEGRYRMFTVKDGHHLQDGGWRAYRGRVEMDAYDAADGRKVRRFTNDRFRREGPW